jgi:predicted transcriptional regulator
MAVKVKRAGSIRVSITEETKQRLQRVADAFGMPAATVASLAIGQYVAQRERELGAVELVSSKVAESVEATLGEQMRLMLSKGDSEE